MIEIILSIWIIVIVYLFYILIRNYFVCEFRKKVNNLAYEYNMRHITNRKKDGWELSYDKLPSYDSMLHSFKRLRLESYFDQKTINELLS